MIDLISWLIFGLIVGAIARLLVPGPQPVGCLYTSLLGVAGSLTGGLIVWLLLGARHDSFRPAGWIMSIVGAIIVILVGRRMFHPGPPVS